MFVWHTNEAHFWWTHHIILAVGILVRIGTEGRSKRLLCSREIERAMVRFWQG